MKDLHAAAKAFSRSIALDPKNADAHLAHVAVLRASGNGTSALAAAQLAQACFPMDARIAVAAAVCHEDLGQSERALITYEEALRIAPSFEDALHNRGLLLARLGRREQAEANYRTYVAVQPESARAHAGLADVLLSRARFDEALEALSSAERLLNNDVSIRVRRGVALSALRRFDEAKAIFANARAVDPLSVQSYLQRVAPGCDPDVMLSPENIYLSRGWAALSKCDWSTWEGFVAEMRRAASHPAIAIEPAVAFMCQHLPLSGAERHAIARRIATTIEGRYPALPPIVPPMKPRIRVGVLSPDFREHLDAYLLLPLFELLDRTRFELFAYSLAADDGSAIRGRVRAVADGFRDLERLTDRDAAAAIREDKVDVLLDVGGHSTGARFAITALRPAPLQASYLAFSCSLASSRLDYAIVDRFAGCDDAEWTEARVFVPDTYYLYDFRNPAPQSDITRRDYGLPDDTFVYCAFHKAEKISPDAFELWARVLARVPRSVLWFRALSDKAASNLRIEAAQRGIDLDRLVFAPFEPSHDPRYLARHRLGDLMLDALHHNALTTMCDALGVGLPCITLPGNALAARAGASLLCAAGLPDLVAKDVDEYVEMAVRLGTNPRAIQAIKARVAANRRTAPLFDTPGRVRALEAAFQQMYDRMMRGEPPASFDVQL